MLNIFYDSYRILTHVYSEQAFIKQAINSEIIEPLNKNSVIKICYGAVDKDIELEYIISQLCSKRPKLPIRILLKISIYCIKYLQKAPYAVTDSAVELCKKLGKSGMSGFLNAILRKYIKSPNLPLPKNEIESLSIKYSYPAFAVKELINDYGKNLAEEIMQYDLPYTFLRFDSSVNGEDYFKELNKEYIATPFRNCYALKNFTRDDGFFEGKYTFQSIGSVAICNVVESGESLLDCCAAPGGKSVALANKFKNITACELHPHRANLIVDYANRMKVNNITVKTQDATQFNEEFLNQFDMILCDAPCSGFGVTKENPDIKLNRQEENISELSKLQLKILKNVSNYLKKGGYLYYSTCSIFNKENDCVIKEFLKTSNFKVMQISSPLAHLKTEFGLQFLPNISMSAGFYICKLQKL